MDKIREITKSAVFLVFSSNLVIFHYFVKRGFPLNMVLTNGSFDAYIDICYHKRPFAMINFDLAKIAFCKCFLELKIHKFLLLEMIPLKFVKNLPPLIRRA